MLRFLGSMDTFMAQGRTNMEPRCHRGHLALNQGRMLDNHVHITSGVSEAFLGRFLDEKSKIQKGYKNKNNQCISPPKTMSTSGGGFCR